MYDSVDLPERMGFLTGKNTILLLSSVAMARSRRFIEDLSEYDGTPDVDRIGMAPLAVGFLQRGQRLELQQNQRPASAKLVKKLLPFCAADVRVFALPRAMKCPLCNEPVSVEIAGESVRLGSAEIRVLGDGGIYAAPDLLPHYIEAHGYQPPDEFVDAVMRGGSGVNSAEFRALINALQ